MNYIYVLCVVGGPARLQEQSGTREQWPWGSEEARNGEPRNTTNPQWSCNETYPRTNAERSKCTERV